MLRSSIAVLGVMGLAIVGCQDLTGNSQYPPGVPDPNALQTAESARKRVTTTRYYFQIAIADAIYVGGLITDELQSNARGSTASLFDASSINIVDSRNLTVEVAEGFGPWAYGSLHNVRGMASQANGALLAYVPQSENLRGLVYAMAGYAEVMLADLYCSGIPLSTLDFTGDFTLAPSSTTAEVYTHAVALFDTAMALAADSLPIVHLASIGKARALLALGEYRAAGDAVADIPPTFVWSEKIRTCEATPAVTNCKESPNGKANDNALGFGDVTVSNREGGREVIAIDNPRTSGTLVEDPLYPSDVRVLFPVYHPTKYATNGISTIIIADGREAQLIRAEVALHTNAPGEWLAILNALRAEDPRTAGLDPIVDPGTEEGRVDTLFAERAQWLFLTGHRQGDLRRLVRNYRRLEHSVYPSGAYPGGLGRYGTFTNLPIPVSERKNPLFRGCLDRRA